jgi:hypothetical protein
MAYVGLGAVPCIATLQDPTNMNTGNWTAVLGPSQMHISHPSFELYHLTIKGGPVGSSLTWYVNNNFYDVTPNGYLNSWDPNQPLELSPGDTLYFYWNASTGTAPIVTGFFRYSTF